MKKNYLSVNDFAEAAGISRQAVYQQIDKKLKKFVKLEQGKKVIDKAALTEIYNIKCEDIDQESQEDIDKVEQENQELIEMLKEQIKIKDRQLEMAYDEKKELHDLISQEQHLNAMNISKIAELETKLELAQKEKVENEKNLLELKQELDEIQQTQKQESEHVEKSVDNIDDSAAAEPDPEKQTAAGTGWWQRIKGLF